MGTSKSSRRKVSAKPKKKSTLNLRILDKKRDDRVHSMSVLVSLPASAYLEFVQVPYEKRGGIEGQREALKTSSAVRIRNRLAEDVKQGAIIPPLTVGIVLPKKKLEKIPEWNETEFEKFLTNIDDNDISIIDGMQRTTVLRDIQSDLRGYEVRVEFWLAEETASLAYRMLILNTGQVPWNLRRQIEVINSSIIKEIRKAGDQWDERPEIYGIGENKRRTAAGEYQANDVTEMYIAFGLRKPQVDKETVLIDQFSRLDMIDAVSNSKFFSEFIDVFHQMNRLDRVFARWINTGTSNERFASGRALFDSTPACVGFMAAAAQIVMGRPGMERKKGDRRSAMQLIEKNCISIVDRLSDADRDEITEFLDFATLNEVLAKPSGKIGEFERALFTDAFRLLLTEGEQLTSMTPCWRSA